MFAYGRPERTIFFKKPNNFNDMFDLKVINSVLAQLEEERGIPREKILEAIEAALATAYKKEYGKKGQIVRAKFDPATGGVEWSQVKIVVDQSKVIMPEEEEALEAEGKELPPEDERIRYNPEHHILIEEARLIKKGVSLDDEIVFPLENKGDYGRIAAQTAKQVIIQKIREAEKSSVLEEYGEKAGEIVTGTVERMERGNVYLNMGRAIGELPYEEQIPGERYKQGERVRAYLFRVDDGMRGVFLKLSRSHPKFLEELFRSEVPELVSGQVVVKSIAREAGSRSKVAVHSVDAHIDPVGSMVGSRGVRVSTITSELGGEKIDIIEWSEDPKKFIEESLSPAKIISIELDETEKKATVLVAPDQQSLAIGKGGQNVRLAAKLTGYKIDIQGIERPSLDEDGESEDATETTSEEASHTIEEQVEEVMEENTDTEIKE